MKTTLKTTISIVAIAISSASFAQAGEHRHDRKQERTYEQPRYQHQKHRSEKRHYRKHHKMSRHAKRHMKALKRAQRFDRKFKHGHNRVYRQDAYITPRYISPRHVSSDVYVDNRHNKHNGLPVLAGTIIGSSIANDLSNGDPAATFGGAVFGAIIGDALSH